MAELRSQLGRFLVAGLGAVGTDALSYHLLLAWVDVAPAKGTSFLLGSCVAFVINKYWTFESKAGARREVPLFVLLYASTLGANVATNAMVLAMLPQAKVFGFLCATGVSTVLNFLGQKFIVFRNPATPQGTP